MHDLSLYLVNFKQVESPYRYITKWLFICNIKQKYEFAYYHNIPGSIRLDYKYDGRTYDWFPNGNIHQISDWKHHKIDGIIYKGNMDGRSNYMAKYYRDLLICEKYY